MTAKMLQGKSQQLGFAAPDDAPTVPFWTAPKVHRADTPPHRIILI
jgi:hypothetical protein